MSEDSSDDVAVAVRPRVEEEYEPGFVLPEGAIHPLLLDVVLNKIFESLRIEELLKCRQVCKTWMQNSYLINSLKKRSVVFLRCIFLHTSTTRENLSSYFQLTGPLYEHFHFTRISYQNELVTHFFRVLGPTIRILKLHLDLNQLNIQQFRELIYERVPNLAELNIYNLSHEEVFLKKLFPSRSGSGSLPEAERPKHFHLKTLEMQEIRSPISRFLIQFLGTLVNLREINLKVDVCSDWSDQADLWRQNSPLATSIIKGLEGSGAYKTLKIFRCGKMRLRHFESLLEMGQNGLQLEHLEVHMPCKNSEETFNNFLATQKESLVRLIVYEQRSARYSHRPKMNEQQIVFMLRIPDRMPNLELLQLSKYPKSVMVPVQTVDYTRQCPRLKELIMLGYSDRHDCGSLYVPKQKCTSLEAVTLWNQVRDPNIAYILGKSFPNLKRITVRYPNQDFLRGLWQSCEELESLTLMLEEGILMDEGITGLPTSLITRWLHSGAEQGGKRKDIEDWLECNQTLVEKNSVRNLKQLRTLKIVVEQDDTSDRQALCNASAYWALKDMKQLRLLTIYSSHWHMGLTQCQFFSQDCCQYLKTQLELTVVNFSPYEA